MAKARTELTWTEIDPASLSQDQSAAYLEYKLRYAAMKTARKTFEDAMQVHAPAGKRVVCGYNFGKLSVALAEAEVRKTKTEQQTLADFLTACAASGVRS